MNRMIEVNGELAISFTGLTPSTAPIAISFTAVTKKIIPPRIAQARMIKGSRLFNLSFIVITCRQVKQ